MSKKHKYRHRQHRSDPVRAKKFLGQHFLKDESIARQIGESITPEHVKNLLEIGPGTGILTKYLLEEDWTLKVMELDWDSVSYLKNDFKKENVAISSKEFEIIEADFLKYDLGKLFPDEEFGIIGNFPYNISSQILFKTIENRERIPAFSGMFQKEVAKRICEGPGSKAYGILSVLTQAFYEAEYLFTVPPGVFSPPPKVDSGVLRLFRKENYHLDCDEKLFFKVVKIGFQQRRKTLRNSLKSFGLSDELRANPIFNKRPEQLSVEDFVKLTEMIGKDRK
ncbi:MAG TPA: 16S rRNA (adenine(1518)-N(6)/adenine(1519)-N(6))-dimethyltransferase RsmA [Flavobacteriaceae bacterium]|nr:16S rRNA (adenine(1518)-N(6)/adenine(1519)-N(6))-dimethyltransferase RsmA [Flavobacteriaceae bacterium]